MIKVTSASVLSWSIEPESAVLQVANDGLHTDRIHLTIGGMLTVTVLARDLQAAIQYVNGTSSPASLDGLRRDGWRVAVHNDYMLNGQLHTFWGMTRGDRFVKGEGLTDEEALAEVRSNIERLAAAEEVR
jgi:hypothetical protein